MATTRLTIFLLQDVADVADVLADGKTPTSIDLSLASGVDGTFYVERRPSSTPAWVPFVQPLLPLTQEGVPFTLQTSSASGLLVLKASERFFALTFGYGRGFLNPAKIVHQFGLRVALNRIDPAQIRSLDTKTFEDMVVTKNTQASKSAELPTFGVDVSRDILRAVTGKPRDSGFAKRLSGSDALVLSLDVKAVDLPGVCSEALAAFHEQTYKADFEWIDHLALVKDQAVTAALDQLLVHQLATGDASNTHMAMPEPIDWEDVDGFKISGTSPRIYDDLDLDAYLEQLGEQRSDITIQRLKSRHVSVRFGRTNEFDKRWTVYQCLITEQRFGGQLHVLIEGKWFVVSETLVDEVDLFTAALPTVETTLVDAFTGEIESSYNNRLAATMPTELLSLDAKIRRPGGASSGIEVCDVLASNGEFIHVKRKSRSSTLSHLFAQGSVSANAFITDGAFRDEIRKVIRADLAEPERSKFLALVPDADAPLDRSKYGVSYVVVANSSKAGTDWLPFFSKLNLMQNGRLLKSLGLRVSISRVPVVAKPDVNRT